MVYSGLSEYRRSVDDMITTDHIIQQFQHPPRTRTHIAVPQQETAKQGVIKIRRVADRARLVNHQAEHVAIRHVNPSGGDKVAHLYTER
jgi:hypothetical protein